MNALRWWWDGWRGCIEMVGWLERMHGRDTALNVSSCNATTMHPLHHQQFNLFFLLLLLTFPAVSFPSAWIFLLFSFPRNLSRGQLKDKSQRIGIVEIKIQWCVCSGSPTPSTTDKSRFPQSILISASSGSIGARNSNIQIHIQSEQSGFSGFISNDRDMGN